MDPIFTPAVIAGLVSGGSALGSAGAGIYGANLQDQQASEQLKYARQRDALADKRQAEQDRIAAEMRRKQELLATLERYRQQRQQDAGMWHPSMAQQPQAGE